MMTSSANTSTTMPKMAAPLAPLPTVAVVVACAAVVVPVDAVVDSDAVVVAVVDVVVGDVVVVVACVAAGMFVVWHCTE